jgi:hypothetical protein
VITMLASLAYAIIQGPSNGWFSVRRSSGSSCSRSPRSLLLLQVRAAPRRAADRLPLLQVGPVQRRQRHRRLRDRRQRRVPLPDHALPAGRARLHRAAGGPDAAADALHDGGLASPISGRIVARGGPRVPFIIAGAALTLSTAALSQLSTTSGPLFLIATYGLFGFGAGMVNVPISNGVMAGVPPRR